jgi:hypothetical protein
MLFKLVVTIVETLNMKPHSNGKIGYDPLEAFNID